MIRTEGRVEIDSRAEEILSESHSLASPHNLEGMARYGINPNNTLGVTVANIRQIAKEFRKGPRPRPTTVGFGYPRASHPGVPDRRSQAGHLGSDGALGAGPRLVGRLRPALW